MYRIIYIYIYHKLYYISICSSNNVIYRYNVGKNYFFIFYINLRGIRITFHWKILSVDIKIFNGNNFYKLFSNVKKKGKKGRHSYENLFGHNFITSFALN